MGKVFQINPNIEPRLSQIYWTRKFQIISSPRQIILNSFIGPAVGMVRIDNAADFAHYILNGQGRTITIDTLDI